MGAVAKKQPVLWTAKRIRKLRIRLGLSIAQAAARVGVRPRTWLSWELPSQKREPSQSHCILLQLLDEGKL